MLTRVLDWSLRNRLAVIVMWACIAVGGVVSALHLPLDAFPDTTPVQVQINTVAPALAPLEIERQITTPVERAITGLPSLRDVRSVSRFGFSQVTVTFDDATSIFLARQLVGERLSAVELPTGIARPTMGPIATGLGEVFHYLVTRAGRSLADARTAQDWIIAPQLRSVPGVAEVNAWGGEQRQLHIVVDPTQLQRFDLSLAELAQSIEANNANVGGGTLDRAGESSLIHGIGLVTSADDLLEMVVATRGDIPVRVRDVARVVDGHEIRRGAVTADGHGEVVLGLGFMLMGENSRDVTARLQLRLREIRRTLPAGIHVTPVYDRTTLVDRVLHTVRTNLFEGALLVVAVLLMFLASIRAGIIVALVIPLSMLFATTLMLQFGIAGSLMSLGAIDFGILVDSAIIQIENVIRRSSAAREGASWLETVRDAVVEVRKPTMFGELIIAIVYLPILTLEGVEGKLFRPMAWTILFALAGSMLLSLTLVPALASLGLSIRGGHRENRFTASLERRYRASLEWVLARPWLVIATAALLLANVAVLATRLGSDFVPRLAEGSIVINKVQLAGVSVEESVRTSTQIERALLEKFPSEIERVWTRTGTGEVATDAMGLELADIFVMLTPRERWRRARTQDELVERISTELQSMPGMRLIYTQPIEMRVNEMVAGIRADLGVRLFGDDLAVAEAKGREIEAVLRRIRGAEDVFTEQVSGQPVLEIQVDRARVARYGIAVREVLAAIQSLGTRQVGLMYEGERRFPIVLRIDDAQRTDEAALGRMLVAASNGDRIPLGRLATIQTVEGPSAINHEWAKRRIVVQANVRGRDLGSFVAEARAAIEAQVSLPPGYYIRYGGQFENLERARARLLVVVPGALLLIVALLYFTYRRWQDTARVFTGVPFAAVGGVVALWIRDMPFTISAGVGFIVLSGVAVLADMVLVSTIRQHLATGTTLCAAILDGAQTRLRPVLMTALVATLGFLPMALNTGFGAEVQKPLATVVIGGLVSSTLLTLFVLPALYSVTARGGRSATAPAPESEA